jgi:hypothetical protein
VAVSNSISGTVFRIDDIINHACRRCKVKPSTLDAEAVETFGHNLYLLTSALANQGYPLWCLEKVILGPVQGQAQLTTPQGTVDIENAILRQVTIPTGTAASSAGGTAANAFDQSLLTNCTQTSADGNISLTYATVQQIVNVGIMSAATLSYALVFERSTDGSNWTTVLTVAAQSYTAGTWYYFDIDAQPSTTLAFRVRETGGATLNVTELVFGSAPTEQPIARLNKDDYFNLNNKTSQGRPLQYWLDRSRVAPILNLWPAPGQSFYQVVLLRHRHIMDPGVYTNEIEVPQRWYDCIVWGLASAMAVELPEVPGEIMAYVDQRYRRALLEAQTEERDNSPIKYGPNISIYTA